MSLYGEYTKTSETHIVHIAAEDGVPVCTHLECPPACNKLRESKCPRHSFEHDPGGEAELFPGVGVWRFEAVFTGTWTDYGLEHDMEYQNITQLQDQDK